MTFPEIVYSSGGHVLLKGESAGFLSQLLGCCGVWHFHTFGLAAQRFPKKLVEWLEYTFTKRTVISGEGYSRPRGMMLLTASEEDGWGSLIKVLRDRPGWEEKKFSNPQSGHEVSLFTLVRGEK